jgi:hypothetical protein
MAKMKKGEGVSSPAGNLGELPDDLRGEYMEHPIHLVWTQSGAQEWHMVMSHLRLDFGKERPVGVLEMVHVTWVNK